MPLRQEPPFTKPHGEAGVTAPFVAEEMGTRPHPHAPSGRDVKTGRLVWVLPEKEIKLPLCHRGGEDGVAFQVSHGDMMGALAVALQPPGVIGKPPFLAGGQAAYSLSLFQVPRMQRGGQPKPFHSTPALEAPP